MDTRLLVGTAIALVVLGAIATITLRGARIPRPWAPVTALLRAALQLGALSLVLAGIITSALWVGVGLAVMFTAAVGTAAGRNGARGRDIAALALAMGAGTAAVMVVVFTTGAIEFSPRYVLAIGGIVIGNTMTIAILSQRIFRTSVSERWDEVEGWLALGATPRQSTLELGRGAIRTALLPTVDQTRTTGIVVLPGAFVGAIFAGASPLEAGRFQLVVLASILAAGAITGIVLMRAGTALPQPRSAER